MSLIAGSGKVTHIESASSLATLTTLAGDTGYNRSTLIGLCKKYGLKYRRMRKREKLFDRNDVLALLDEHKRKVTAKGYGSRMGPKARRVPGPTVIKSDIETQRKSFEAILEKAKAEKKVENYVNAAVMLELLVEQQQAFIEKLIGGSK